MRKLSIFLLLYILSEAFFYPEKVKKEEVLIKNKSSLNLTLQNSEKAVIKVLEKNHFSYSGIDFIYSQNYDFEKFSKPACCLSYNLQKMQLFPLSIKYGNLSLSGDFSRLKNPYLSNGTSYIKNFSPFLSGIKSSLQSPSSDEKNFSLFYEYNFTRKVKKDYFQLKSSFFYNEKDEKALNLMLSLPLNLFEGKKVKTGFSIIYSELKKSNSSSSWFSREALFPEKKLISSSFQTFYSGRNFFLRAAINLNEKPYYLEREKAFLKNFNLEGKIKYDISFLSLNLYSAGTYNAEEKAQFQLNPYLLYYSKNKATLWNFGINFLQEEFLNSNLEVEKKQNYVIGFERKSKKSRITFTAGIKDIYFEEREAMEKSFEFYKFSLFFNEFLLEKISLSYSKKNLKGSLLLIPLKKEKLSCKSDFVIVIEENNVSLSNFKISSSFKKKIKNLCLDLSFSLKIALN